MSGGTSGQAITMPNFRLDDKVALVTGGSSGLGRHFAQVLAAAGAAVAVTARREDALAETVAAIESQGGRAGAAVMDVKDSESVAGAFAETERTLGKIDIVINNAGVTTTQRFHEIDDQSWDHVIDTNLSGVFKVGRAAANAMIKHGQGGAIVNIASLLSLRVGGQLAAYGASKAAVAHLTQTMALELARYRIRVNALAPGYIATNLNREFLESPAGEKLASRVPQRRFGGLSDLDGPLLLLAGDTAAYMTGSMVVVDGGHAISSI